MKASGAPSKGDLVTTKLRYDAFSLAIMGLVVGETGTRVDIKVLKPSFNPGNSWLRQVLDFWANLVYNIGRMGGSV